MILSSLPILKLSGSYQLEVNLIMNVNCTSAIWRHAGKVGVMIPSHVGMLPQMSCQLLCSH